MITISFKVSTGSTFDLQIDATATIAEVKRQAATASGIPDAQMRLIYKGRILKDSETLEQNKIESGHTLHLVKGPGAAAPAPAAPAPAAAAAPAPIPLPASASAPIPSGFASQELLGTPMMQQMMAVMSQNPEMMATVLRSNPEFQRMAQQNPHLNMILQNPDLLRIMLNPQMMQAAMQMQQAFASSVGQTGQAGQAGQAGQTQALMQLLQQNPELANSMMQGGEEGEFNAPPPPAAVAELEIRFQEQLEQMALMGFTERLQNIEALRVSDGNVEAAINYLLTYGQN